MVSGRRMLGIALVLLVVSAGLPPAGTSGEWTVPSWLSGLFTSAAAADEDPSPTTYEDLVIAGEPELYWRLGETGGPTAYDASGNGRDGTYAAGVVFGPLPSQRGRSQFKQP